MATVQLDVERVRAYMAQQGWSERDLAGGGLLLCQSVACGQAACGAAGYRGAGIGRIGMGDRFAHRFGFRETVMDRCTEHGTIRLSRAPRIRTDALFHTTVTRCGYRKAKTANHRATRGHLPGGFWTHTEPTRFPYHIGRNIGKFQGREGHKVGIRNSGTY